jgi:hypothetical protein
MIQFYKNKKKQRKIRLLVMYVERINSTTLKILPIEDLLETCKFGVNERKTTDC